MSTPFVEVTGSRPDAGAGVARTGLVEVAVMSAAPGRYHYKLPRHLAARVAIGSRVLVKFGGQRLTGVVVRADTAAPPDVTPIEISELLDDEPALPAELVELCLWIADYYEAPIGEVIRAALPAGSGVKSKAVYALTEKGRAAADGQGAALPAKQRVWLVKLADADLPAVGASKATKHVLDALINAGLAELRDQRTNARARLARERVARLVVDAGAARAAVARAPKKLAVIEAFIALARGAPASAAGEPADEGDGAARQVHARYADDGKRDDADGDEPAPDVDESDRTAEPAEDELRADSSDHVVLLDALEERIAGAKSAVRELAKAGIVEVFEREAPLEAVAIGEAMHAGAPPTLTDEQAVAVAEITAALFGRRTGQVAEVARARDVVAPPADRVTPLAAPDHVGSSSRSAGRGELAPFLLFGVTGSGKTEVYLRVIAEALVANRTALVLVPEISLTPQLAARFRARFGDQVAILHSGLSETARLGEWSRLRRGDARIAVGARSAVFAPLTNLGVIVVDEEHDGSFKQDEGVKYHARDVALVRAQRAGAVCVLGSGTPSLESAAQAERGFYKKLVLTQRPMARPMPTVEVIDLRTYQPDLDSFLSARLREAIAATIAAGDQVILFLNRRGFATFVLCVGCGHAFRCPNCAVSLTYHRHSDRLNCHYCDRFERVPEECPKCGGVGTIERKGLGTEKVADAVATMFPTARVARLDRDVASGARAEGVLAKVARREVDILVGTQMVTKGHDFPGVTLVGVLCADTGLDLPDFRASERTFQLLAQVAGRAGRGDRPGHVLIQTYRPTAPAVVAAAVHDYERFFTAEMAARADLWPPHRRVIVVRIDGPNEHDVAEAAQRIAQLCEQVARRLEPGRNESAHPQVEIRGPVAAPLARLRGRSRWQIWIRGVDRQALRRVARQALTVEVGHKTRVSLDVDPVSVL